MRYLVKGATITNGKISFETMTEIDANQIKLVIDESNKQVLWSSMQKDDRMTFARTSDYIHSFETIADTQYGYEENIALNSEQTPVVNNGYLYIYLAQNYAPVDNVEWDSNNLVMSIPLTSLYQKENEINVIKSGNVSQIVILNENGVGYRAQKYTNTLSFNGDVVLSDVVTVEVDDGVNGEVIVNTIMSMDDSLSIVASSVNSAVTTINNKVDEITTSVLDVDLEPVIGAGFDIYNNDTLTTEHVDPSLTSLVGDTMADVRFLASASENSNGTIDVTLGDIIHTAPTLRKIFGAGIRRSDSTMFIPDLTAIYTLLTNVNYGATGVLEELFSAIGTIRDRLNIIRNEIVDIRTDDLSIMNALIVDIRSDISTIKTSEGNINNDTTSIKNDINSIKTDIGTINTGIVTINTNITGIIGDSDNDSTTSNTIVGLHKHITQITPSTGFFEVGESGNTYEDITGYGIHRYIEKAIGLSSSTDASEDSIHGVQLRLTSITQLSSADNYSQDTLRGIQNHISSIKGLSTDISSDLTIGGIQAHLSNIIKVSSSDNSDVNSINGVHTHISQLDSKIGTNTDASTAATLFGRLTSIRGASEGGSTTATLYGIQNRLTSIIKSTSAGSTDTSSMNTIEGLHTHISQIGSEVATINEHTSTVVSNAEGAILGAIGHVQSQLADLSSSYSASTTDNTIAGLHAHITALSTFISGDGGGTGVNLDPVFKIGSTGDTYDKVTGYGIQTYLKSIVGQSNTSDKDSLGGIQSHITQLGTTIGSIWGLSTTMGSIWGLSTTISSIWGLSTTISSIWGLSTTINTISSSISAIKTSVESIVSTLQGSSNTSDAQANTFKGIQLHLSNIEGKDSDTEDSDSIKGIHKHLDAIIGTFSSPTEPDLVTLIKNCESNATTVYWGVYDAIASKNIVPNANYYTLKDVIDAINGISGSTGTGGSSVNLDGLATTDQLNAAKNDIIDAIPSISNLATQTDVTDARSAIIGNSSSTAISNTLTGIQMHLDDIDTNLENIASTDISNLATQTDVTDVQSVITGNSSSTVTSNTLSGIQKHLNDIESNATTNTYDILGGIAYNTSTLDNHTTALSAIQQQITDEIAQLKSELQADINATSIRVQKGYKTTMKDFTFPCAVKIYFITLPQSNSSGYVTVDGTQGDTFTGGFNADDTTQPISCPASKTISFTFNGGTTTNTAFYFGYKFVN